MFGIVHSAKSFVGTVTILCIGLSLSASGLAQSSSVVLSEVRSSKPLDRIPAPAQAARPVVGLVLEGGGALGIAHIGVVEWMNEHHVPVDRIAGTSMGALVGAFLAAGYRPEEIAQFASPETLGDLFAVKPPISHLSFRRRQDRHDLPHAVTFGLRSGSFTLGNGLIADDPLDAFLGDKLLAYNSAELRFDELPIPFRCVATDLTTLKPYVFDQGSLPFAVRASISIPGVFAPVPKDGDILVDGAIVDNLPTDVMRVALHADIVISVHLKDPDFAAKNANSLVNVFSRALEAGVSRNEEISRKLADIELLPELKELTPTDYEKGAALLRAGYQAAEAQHAKLLPLALTEFEWERYQAAIQERRRIRPGIIRKVSVQGPDAARSAKLAKQANVLTEKPFDAERADNIIATLRGNGDIDVYLVTAQQPYRARNQTLPPPPSDDAVVVRWQPRADGPPFLLFGTDFVGMSGNVSQTVFDFRLVDQDLGGYGRELRIDAQTGYRLRFASEYFLPLGERGLFVQPRTELFRTPVYLWRDQKRVSEQQLQRAGGGVDVGWTFNRYFQAAFQYRDDTLHWFLQSGVELSPTSRLSGMTESVAGHLLFSDRTAEIASPRGTRFELTAGKLLQTTQSEQAPFLRAELSQTWTLAGRNLLNTVASADTYFRKDVADPLRFTLGGPMRLYASSVDEYRGTDTAYTRVAYLRRIATLPTGAGQGVYLAGGYEAGSIWSPEERSILREDGFAGVLVSTPFGAATLGAAVGDAGHRKLFFTFGKLF